MYFNSKLFKRVLPACCLLVLNGLAHAKVEVPEGTITGRAVAVKSDIMSIVSLIGVISTVAGVAFFMMTFLNYFRFSHHKF